MQKADIGLIGLAVMGENLALNIESKGFSIAVFNRTISRVDDLINGRARNKDFIGTKSIEEFVDVLSSPRKIILLVKAGDPVDQFIDMLVPYLDEGDLIIDGGSSDAYVLVEPIFTKIAAQVDGMPCCSYIGDDGAGHYVKMVHNGIEYGDMQLICEAYALMTQVLGMDAQEVHQAFDQWNQGELGSYLIEITADIFTQFDQSGVPLVDQILDQAGQKGTGKWTGISALTLGVSVPTIVEAVFARCISAVKSERVAASKVLSGPQVRFEGDKNEFLSAIGDALYAAKICSYAQGFGLMRQASFDYEWDLDFGQISLGWRGGCIIRAKFLYRIAEAFDRNSDLPNLLLDDYFQGVIESTQPNWRRVIVTATQLGIPIPAFSSALAYFDSYRSARVPANLIQAQRDYFGAHTYHKINSDGDIIVDTVGEPVVFHTEWMLEDRPEIEV